MHSFDPDLLRTFLAFVDGGSLARAAAIVGRSPSAVTAQMQRLEDVAGQALLAPAGRGRALTPVGEEFDGHARRILAAHREAWLSLKGAVAEGRVAVGATQDFGLGVLPERLRDFARLYPGIRLDLRIGRSVELTRAFEEGSLDLVIAMRQAPVPDEIGVLREPMIWLGALDGPAFSRGELPLALLDPPCGFRSAAIGALDKAGRAYRIAATSPSLSGLQVAVKAGMAITLRTARWVGDGIADISGPYDLPDAGRAEFSIRLHPNAGEPAADLARLVRDGLNAEAI
jgi:DNA-binding transcriptional LysR family regulator